jgi:hypothetical protein
MFSQHELSHDHSVLLGSFCGQHYECDNPLEKDGKTVPEVDIDFQMLLYLKRVFYRDHRQTHIFVEHL